QGRGAVVKEIRAEIYIEAKPEWVWRVITNFEAYPKWNPVIRSFERIELSPGSRPKLAVQWPGEEPRSLRVTLVKAIPAQELRWRDNGIASLFFNRECSLFIEPERTGTKLI